MILSCQILCQLYVSFLAEKIIQIKKFELSWSYDEICSLVSGYSRSW